MSFLMRNMSKEEYTQKVRIMSPTEITDRPSYEAVGDPGLEL